MREYNYSNEVPTLFLCKALLPNHHWGIWQIYILAVQDTKKAFKYRIKLLKLEMYAYYLKNVSYEI